MESFSTTVLVWFFGSWILDPNHPAALSGMTEVTPLSIFASYFSTVGLAMFGVLGSWAIFLGIFRLRQGGNFFGAKDANEAFFYPMRMIFAMGLCAPVVMVANIDGTQVMLTPGHSMIAGIAKQASEFGDAAQADSFELMNKFNLFKEPNFNVSVSREAAKTMLVSWYGNAVQAASTVAKKDPAGIMAGLTPEVIAQAMLESKWNKQVSSDDLKVPITGVNAEQAIVISNMDKLAPVIPPTDAIARKTSFADSGLVAATADQGTALGEMQTEGMLCSESGWRSWMSTTVCSDEYQSVKKNNSESISAGIAEAQRWAWVQMVTLGVESFKAFDTDMSPQQAKTFNDESGAYADAAAKAYAKKTSDIIKNTLATDQATRQAPYYDEVKKWGWMLGGTFVLRAASDFSRAASYADDATSKMLPQTSLASLTTADTVSKLVETQALAQIQPGGGGDESKSLFTKIFELDFLRKTTGPDAQNLHNTAAWGRALVGSGLGMYGAGTIASWTPWKVIGAAGDDIIKPIGAIMIAAGGLIGYVLPLLFAIYGLMGAITWLVTVASTFFGVTLWAAGMAAPKGEEHTSQLSAKGWNALIFIGLYPALAVGGLAAAVVVSAVGLSMVQMLAMGLWGMFDPGTAEIGRPLESLGGMLIGGAIIVLAVVLLSWNVVVTSAQLVTNFPRAVLNMISLSEPGLNPYENNMNGIMGGISMSGRQMLTGALSSAISRNMSKAKDGTRSLAGGLPSR